MADVAAETPVVDTTPVDEVKETVKEVPTPVEPETAAEAPEVAAEGAKETENGNTNGNGTTEEEAPTENGTEKNGHSTENGTENGENGTENGDVERKRKSELPVDGDAAIEVSSEKKAKLEEKSEEVANGGAVEGEPEVVA